MSKLANRPRKSPKQERSAELVSAIYEASVRIFESTKKIDFSTRTVAEVAGISIGSLYQYFPNKEALIGALIERESVKHTVDAQALFEKMKDNSFEEITLGVVSMLFKRVASKKYFLRGILKSVFHVERLETIIENREKAMVIVRKALLDRKIVSDEKLAATKAYVITALVGGIVETIVFRDDEVITVDELAVQVSEMIVKYCKTT